MNIDESRKYLEEIISLRLDSHNYEDFEMEDKLRALTEKILQKKSLLNLLIIKTTTDSIVLKFDIEDEIKRRVEDATKNYDWWNI